jgi:hypothetical protein
LGGFGGLKAARELSGAATGIRFLLRSGGTGGLLTNEKQSMKIFVDRD